MNTILVLIEEAIIKSEEKLHIYIMYDGVKCENLYTELENSFLNYDMLFKEEKPRKELKEIAPYLVELDFTKNYSENQSKSVLEYFKNNSGIVILSYCDFKIQLDNLREVFYVYDEDEKLEGFFRFYDALILETLIEIKNQEVLEILFKNTLMCFYNNPSNKDEIIKYKKNGILQ